MIQMLALGLGYSVLGAGLLGALGIAALVVRGGWRDLVDGYVRWRDRG